jgi:serine protease Do
MAGRLRISQLESNGVAYAAGTDTAALPPADLSEHAKRLGVFVASR